MPPMVDFPADVEVWTPRELHAKLPSRSAHNWQVIGRLADGVTLEQARADVSAIARRLLEQHGRLTYMKDIALVPLQEQIIGRAKGTLSVLLAGSLLLLLIACANVVNLLIARMSTRQAEVALRVALGAGRARMVQQCLAESLLLSLSAAVLGVVMALAGVKLLLALQPGNLPRMHEVRVDWQVLLFAVGIATIAAIGMGVITAWRGMRGELRDALAQSQRTQGGTMSSERNPPDPRRCAGRDGGRAARRGGALRAQLRPPAIGQPGLHRRTPARGGCRRERVEGGTTPALRRAHAPLFASSPASPRSVARRRSDSRESDRRARVSAGSANCRHRA